MSPDSDNATVTPIYAPTPDPVLNARLALAQYTWHNVRLNINEFYMNQLRRLDPSSPEYHSTVQMILLMQSEHMSYVDGLFQYLIRRLYVVAGVHYFDV